MGHPGLPNGQPSTLSPAGIPHKSRKRPAVGSLSSADDDVESVEGEGESMGAYYKSALVGSHHWQNDHVDHSQ